MSCEGKLSYKECFEALQDINHNKSPGYDGLNLGFFTTYLTKGGHYDPSLEIRY